jgi:hypothetical protein
MTVPQLTSRYNPSFFRFPIANARTAYLPVWMPLVLVEPAKRDPNTGERIADSSILSLEFYIEDAPNLRAPVAGVEHRGIFRPDLVLFKITVTTEQLFAKQINLDGVTFHQGTPDGTIIDRSAAKDGDFFDYALNKNECQGSIPFYADIDYYDLSSFEIVTIDLPTNRYNFVWQVSYHPRTTSPDDELVCVDVATTSLTNFKQQWAHPGELHKQMLDRTPGLYFQGTQALDQEPLTKFYRVYADILQDIFDESALLQKLNWINYIPAQLIPYLANLIGWDLPSFPNLDAAHTDNIRRAILKNAVRLQKLKTTRRAIGEMFEIFGYAVKLINTYFLVGGDGWKDVIAPDEKNNRFKSQSVTSDEICQLDVALADFGDESQPFGGFEVPLLHRPSGDNITLTAYLVTIGSPLETILNQVITDLSVNTNSYNENSCFNVGGFIQSKKLLDKVGSAANIGYAQVQIDARTGQALADTIGRPGFPTISKESVSYDKSKNIVNLGFHGSIDFSNARVFVFTSYARMQLTFNPPELEIRQSNRFDVDFTSNSDQNIDPRSLDYLLSFLFKLKAFHSLLRKIKFPINLTEVYNVTDFTVGGSIKQKPGTDAGELQVPPPIIPLGDRGTEIPKCQVDRGFKPEDIALRQAILNGLEEEHAAWKARDDTPDIPDVLKPVFQHLSRIEPFNPTRVECKYNPFGQDRVTTDKTIDQDHEEDTRTSVCDLSKKPTPDYTYTGRVKALLDVDQILDLTEIVRCHRCRLMLGNGLYAFTRNPYHRDAGLNERKDKGQEKSKFVGKMLQQYDAPAELLHFIHGPFNHTYDFQKAMFLGILRPSLEVEKDNLWMPGHRHPRLSALSADFTHPTWQARPWDYEFTCLGKTDPLHAHLIDGSDGSQYIVFDDVPLTYIGNGLVEDISSLGNQEQRHFRITHSIHTHADPRSWDSIFDSTITFTSSACISPTDPFFVNGLFHSVTSSGDFIDGYPADDEVFDISAGSGSEGSGPFTIRFTLGSGILVEKSDSEYQYYEGKRLDCECLRFSEACGSGGSEIPFWNGSGTEPGKIPIQSCSLEQFIDKDGNYDFNCDRVEAEETVVLPESVGVCSTQLDGTIPSLLCLLSNGLIPLDPMTLPPTGSFRYRDDYGVIYDGIFEYNGTAIDITVVIFSPRVPGEPDQGRVVVDDQGRHIYFKRGTLTTKRQIIEITPTGYRIISEGGDTRISTERINDICGERPCTDEFCFHLDCQTLDDLDIEVIVPSSGA